MKVLIAIGLEATAVNATCDDPQKNLLVLAKETERVPAFSRDTGRQLQLGSCHGERLGTALDSACLTFFSRSQGI